MTSLMLRPTLFPDLFQDLFDVRREFDELFNRFFGQMPWWSSEQAGQRMLTFVPPIEAAVDTNNKRYHLRVALPGVDPSAVSVEVQGNTLTIRGEVKSTHESRDVNYLARELTYGAFERTVTLPEGVDTNNLSAEYKNGVLEISAPIASAALPRRIEIKGLPEAKKAAA